MNICIGSVIAVQGVKVHVKANDISTHDVMFHQGEKYDGISIKGFVLIRRGFRDIVCKVEGEFLEEHKLEKAEGHKVSEPKPIRKIEARPIGYFEKGKFEEGVKYLPMIQDKAYLASDTQISDIINPKPHDVEEKNNFVIGRTVNEGLPVYIPWQNLFNTHIGVFGNTGSGKSNTLTKLYTELFRLKGSEFSDISEFVIMDFNGEYTTNQILPAEKKEVLKLTTRDDDGDKIRLKAEQFWNTETLCLLFKATDNTQKPFINRLVRGRKAFGGDKNSLENYFRTTFQRVFTSTSQRKEIAGLFAEILDELEAEIDKNNEKSKELAQKIRSLAWSTVGQNFYIGTHGGTGNHFNGGERDSAYQNHLKPYLDGLNFPDLSFYAQLKLRINLQLINDLQNGYAQFEHIQPLLKRAESFTSSMQKVILVDDSPVKNNFPLKVISLRNCNQDIKKIIPLLLAKQLYESHKSEIDSNKRPNKTLHLIIDEAHNILSAQSIREQESWKDYRLELFEEIIKEGRKFGVFLTISSQRPSDISATIMSQIHNFFIHRLVNDKDLALLDSTINTLDKLSKERIPHLSKGCCIITGTTFDMPLLIQVERLNSEQQPDSEDVDLEELWLDWEI